MSKKEDNIITIGTLYELNQQIMHDAKELTETDLEKIRPHLEAWFNWEIDGYAMLLCNDQQYYTLFHLYEKQNPYPPKIAVDELFACLKNLGQIQSIEKASDDNYKSWEIWISQEINPITHERKSFVYHLFNYDNGVIEC